MATEKLSLAFLRASSSVPHNHFLVLGDESKNAWPHTTYLNVEKTSSQPSHKTFS